MTGLADLPATELVPLFVAGDTYPSEVLEAVLQRAAVWEPQIRPFTQFLKSDARVRAKLSDERYASGRSLSLVDGVPVTVKENIATVGDPYRMGTAATASVVSEADAPAAARLREAGALIFAKTTMPDFGMLSSGVSSLHPTTRNPHNPEWNPGGSSAGAGAAAAAGIGPIHIGTDIGGSIRLPACWCGVAGFKPSFGRVPVDPPYYARCAGPIARQLADIALAMSVLSLPDERDRMSLPYAPLPWTEVAPHPVAGLRIGVGADSGAGVAPASEVLEVLDEAARALERSGATVERIGPLINDELLDGLDRFWRTRCHLELRELGEERAALALPYIRAWAAPAQGYSAEQVFVGFSAMDGMSVAAGRAFGDLDLLLTPVAPMATYAADAAGPIGPERALAHIGFTVPFSMSGHPAISVPWGTAADGRPVGIQLVGRRYHDIELLAVAMSCEQLRPRLPDWPS